MPFHANAFGGGLYEWDNLSTPSINNNNPPTNTSPPTISNTPPPNVGNTLEVDDGVWQGSGSISITYQWQLDGVDITGQTFKTILLLAGMVGSTLRCIVRATNSFGFSTYTTAGVVVIL